MPDPGAELGLSLDGRVALVSGGGTGIGLAIARRLMEAGARVTLVGRRGDVLAAAVAELDPAGEGGALAVAGDVSRPEDCDRVVAATVARFGGLHVLVNNAAVFLTGALEDASREDVDRVFDVNLKGPVFLTRAALPELRRSEGDATRAILNISTSATRSPVPRYSLYSASKAGIEMLTQCWALDLGGDGIRVNAICPGIVRTPVFESMMPVEEVEGFLASFDEVVPLGRVGEPDDVARLALFLCSPAGAWMTGAVIPLDGGLSLASSG